MSGYEKFFKDARRVNKEGMPHIQNSSKPTARPKFKLRDGENQSIRTPEENLRRVLAERIAKKKKRAIRRKQEFPALPAAFAIVTFIVCGVGYFKPDLTDQLFSQIEIGAFGQAQAADGKNTKDPKDTKDKKVNGAVKGDAQAPANASAGENLAGSDGGGAASSAGLETGLKASSAPDIKNWSEEELSFFKKLNERKQELDLREAELNKLEEELQRQKVELDEKIKRLETTRTQISQTLKSRVANDQEKVDKLVQFYSNMKPQQAAKIIETINEDLAVEVLDKMKKRNAAEIMNMMDAKKARKLSELLTGYQRTPAGAEREEAAEAAPASEADENEDN